MPTDHTCEMAIQHDKPLLSGDNQANRSRISRRDTETKMKVAIAADHAGLPLKPEIVEFVRSLGHEPVDLGAHEYDADDDYPDFSALVAKPVQG